jgi:hypothetical protein
MTEKNPVQRLHKIATESENAPTWLRNILTRIAEHADHIRPLPDDRTVLPEFIYRH